MTGVELSRLAFIVACTVVSLDLGPAMSAGATAQDALEPFAVVGDAIPVSLTGAKGDPGRGRACLSLEAAAKGRRLSGTWVRCLR